MKRLASLVDPFVALALGAAYVGLLLATAGDLGYARDEGFYFQAARSYQGWFELLSADPSAAMQRANIDRFWQANNEHPALMKALFALSEQFLHRKWHWFATAGTAFRFPGMLMSGLAVAVIYLWGRRVVSRLAGALAAVSFAMMPRVFYHAHLDCFDLPVAAMWLVTAYAYFRSLGSGLRWAIATGILYGLLLNTKHNAWLLPPAVLVHFLVVRGATPLRELRIGRLSLPTALIAMATLGPLVFYATWPWIWHDTGRRFTAYVAFHLHHDYYNMEFLGRTHWKPPMPRGYAWLMTVATVPAVTLVLALVGFARSARRALALERIRRLLRRSPSGVAATPDELAAFSAAVLWLLCILTSYAPWLSTNTPIFGGTKHWITAYPFLCLFAAVGFEAARRALATLAVERFGPAVRFAVDGGLWLALVLAPTFITLQSHPWGLGAYTPLVGGAPGAATLGLNRSFWGYTTGSVAHYLNERAPPNTAVFVHDTALQSWDQMIADGVLRRDLRGTLSIHGSGLALYHYEPHMGRVEYQIWTDYGTTAPASLGLYDGVPVVWVYARPSLPPP